MPTANFENDIYPPELKEAEREAVVDRRERAGIAGEPRTADDRVGLALSGGGIRSATFALGLLQALAGNKLLRHVDFLSTVSGGGYIGAFLGRLFTRFSGHDRQEFRRQLAAEGWFARDADDSKPPEAVESAIANSFSPPIQWLRENGRYLSPNGAGDTMIGIAVMLRNWFAARTVLWTLLLTVFVAFNLLRCAVAWPDGIGVGNAGWDGLSELAGGRIAMFEWANVWWSPAVALLPLFVVLWMVPTAWAYWLFPIVGRDCRADLFLRANIVVILMALAAPEVAAFADTAAPNVRPVLVVFLFAALWLAAYPFVRMKKSHRVSGRRLIEISMRAVSGLLAALIVIWVVLRPEVRDEFSEWLLPWRGETLPAAYTMPGLLWAFLVVLVAGAVLWTWLRIGGASENPSASIPEFCKGSLTLCVVGIALAVFGPMLIDTARFAESSDFIAAVAVAALLRSAIPDRDRKWWKPVDLPLHGALVAAVVVLGLLHGLPALSATAAMTFSRFCGLVALCGSLALVLGCVGTAVAYSSAADAPADPEDADAKGRHVLSVWLKNGLIVALAVGGYAVIDSCGQSLYAVYAAAEHRETGTGFQSIGIVLATIAAAIVAVVAASRQLAARLLGGDRDRRLKLRWELLALLAAVGWGLFELVAVNSVSHGLAWGWQLPLDDPGGTIAAGLVGEFQENDAGQGTLREAAMMSFPWLFPSFVVLFLVAWAQGQSWAFVNRSTFSTLYAARLTRAYLGASNAQRWRGPEEAVTQVVHGDAAGLGEYLPHRAGGPLHLINVTINETASGRSQIEQRDRKGLSLAFGPLGASVHRRHHALWHERESGQRAATALQPIEAVVETLATIRETLHQINEGLRNDLTDLQKQELAQSVQSACNSFRDGLRTLEAVPRFHERRTQWTAQVEFIRAEFDKSCASNAAGILEHVATSAAMLRRLLDSVANGVREWKLDLVPINPKPPTPGAAGEGPFRVFEVPPGVGQIPCDEIPVALAMTISGAAFTTGLGARTSLGLSLLCGLLNVRLGHWWNSGVNPRDRHGATRPGAGGWIEWQLSRLFPVQMTLLQEFTARFHGPARRHWYLSDGGHYENLGGYELIRRRIPWIIVSDAEADPDYTFEGLAKLVRTARIDFGAEIRFLTGRELDILLDAGLRRHFGTPDELRGRWSGESAVDPHADATRTRISVDPAKDKLSLRHAALAWVSYPREGEPRYADPETLLVYVKPTLTGDEPEDVRKYHADHVDFPQETTADQFFDEAQWESYRKLGEHIGRQVFPDSIRYWRNGLHTRHATPGALFGYVALIAGLELDQDSPGDPADRIDSGGDWIVLQREFAGRAYLILRNLSTRELEYRFHGGWCPQFRHAQRVLEYVEGRWLVPTDADVSIPGSIRIAAGAAAVLRAPETAAG